MSRSMMSKQWHPNHLIKKIADFRPYTNLPELVHQAIKEECQVQDDIKRRNAKRALAQWLGMRLCSLTTRVQFLELTGDAQGFSPIY